MDEAVALVLLAPVLAVGLWLVDFTGRTTLAAGQGQTAAYQAAQAAASQISSPRPTSRQLEDAVQTARRLAHTALLDICPNLENAVTVLFIATGGSRYSPLTWTTAPPLSVLNKVEVSISCDLPVSGIFNPNKTIRAQAEIAPSSRLSTISDQPLPELKVDSP